MTETDYGVARLTVLMGVGAGPWQRTDVRPCARIAEIWSSDYWANKGPERPRMSNTSLALKTVPFVRST